MTKGYQDCGPLLDVVLYEQDGVWRAAIDQGGEGDLREVTPMAPAGPPMARVITFHFGTGPSSVGLGTFPHANTFPKIPPSPTAPL